MNVVTRFPPSPTGFMHIGTARVALFNWLFAKRHGGKMLFRIEDTDRARHNEEAVTALINAMHWLEMDWEGDIVSQFEQRNRHIEIAEELLDKGLAYRCYCSQEELSEMRETAKKEGRPVAYDRRWRDRDASEASDGVEPVIRIKAPLGGESTIKDHVQGEVSVQNDHLDDFIILRSDGTPTYMLSVVVDDHDMGITHVIRGDDHLNNTFRQNIIYDAMGWDKPDYAHLPMILGPDGSKMSKRHGAASVEEYRELGYLPEAMCNYLLRLGWSHGDDEIISRDQAVEWFDLGHVQKSPARFDFTKLESVNAHYIKEADPQRLIELITPILKEKYDVKPNEALLKGMPELQDRAKTLLQLAEEGAFYAKTLPLPYDEKAQKMLEDEGAELLSTILSTFQGTESFDHDSIQNACKEIANDHKDGKLGKVAMPIRAAITGTTVSPSVFSACEILGQEETCARIQAAINHLSA